jgi:hypothetical protein
MIFSMFSPLKKPLSTSAYASINNGILGVKFNASLYFHVKHSNLQCNLAERQYSPLRIESNTLQGDIIEQATPYRVILSSKPRSPG